jgi:hypothetical protein
VLKDTLEGSVSVIVNSDSESKGEDPDVQDKSNHDEDKDSEDLVPSAYPARKKAERQAALKMKKVLKGTEVRHTCDSF